MFEQFYPDVWIDSAYGIDYEKMYDRGIRGLIYDIDNTLVPDGAPSDERSRKLLAELRDIGFSCCLLSNNKEERVNMFNRDVGAMYICKAGKPGREGYIKAMEMMGTDRSSTVFIGDQLFTDVWGARRSGIYSILVKPMDKREEIQIVFKRRLESIVLFFYRKHLKKS